jgi:hypothetical protein
MRIARYALASTHAQPPASSSLTTPARQALKKAEKAKNKKARVETRKIATVKSDTRGLEKDVTDLGAQGPLPRLALA